MRKEQLLNFINGPEEKFESTNKIAQKAKINHYVAQRLLTELWVMDRPLVEKVSFGKGRDFILWKRTSIDHNALDKALKIETKDRDTGEHKTIILNKWGGNIHYYINDIIKEMENN